MRRLFNLIIILTLCLLPLSGQAAFDLSLIPSDNHLKNQGYFNNLYILDAWDIKNKSPEVVVAVIDSGVDIEHPDLYQNIWTNPGEIAGDQIDNDNNGYIDDINGWDFVLNIPDPRPKLTGKFTNLGINHGTLVSGVIGAMGDNNFGLAGVSWQIKIMPLKMFNGEGNGDLFLLEKAINYAIDKGADIINLSLVGVQYDQSLQDIIKKAYDNNIIIVAAAGNETVVKGSDQDFGLDLSENPQYPICYDGLNGANYVLGVGSVDRDDKKSAFSNYGTSCLDVYAPGENYFGLTAVLPASPDYLSYFGGYYSGTSLSAPLVSGTAALLKSLRPDLTNQEIYSLIIESADDITRQNPGLSDKLGGGRLNVYAALEAAKGLKSNQRYLIFSPRHGSEPKVMIYTLSGQKISEFLAYEKSFRGGLEVASADLDGDGQAEIITAAGQSGGPHVRIFSQSGQLKGQFFAYNANFTGGVSLTAADLDGDGQAEIITAPQTGLEPLIRVFDFKGVLKSEFLAYEKSFTGGINLTSADIDANGRHKIVTASRAGRVSQVKIFDSEGNLINSFKPYGDFSGGVTVVGKNAFFDQRDEILTFPEQNHLPELKYYSASGEVIHQFLAVNENIEAPNIARENINQTELVVIGKSRQEYYEVQVFNMLGELISWFSLPQTDPTEGFNLSFLNND
ncbi:MAG: hypothetical protein COU22_00280 [Candidatus Komeilibacteria bacterium CG10_big_fil_rev_8_21_14_0_10_41_13]|uniref:Peptidase S8/S53 domain-containing protein n=1 Tax=Candidatus Komeilibacteria bacterium CG10_big_fil_rev_8_21_14_0_10_41_13 TaxID=1974476 RepID=A0A2M6WDC7_9BACT|nr:MAG: hypothetical protein COU22_00280 [Candidatus Komeilibacteria bacterium CG10_big_fil_rev_8_21_14_0_10_41_13]